MELKLSNFNKPSHKKWKLIADIGLYALPIISGAIVSMPVSDVIQKWIIFGLTLVTIGFKTISKFTTDGETTSTI